MTRLDLMIVALVNGLALVVGWSLSEYTGLILLLVIFGNLMFLTTMNNKLLGEKERMVLQLKSINLQHEKNVTIKSAQLETIVSNLPFPMALIDNKGNVVLFNHLFQQFTKTDIVSEEGSTKDYIPEIRTFLRNTYISEEAVRKNLNINSIDYQAISVPVYDDKRIYTGCLVMFLDITQILEGERIQKRFIADASHELKTPLSSITGMIQILNRPDFNDEETRIEFSHQIQEEAQRMDNIIQDMLLLSKLSSKQVILELGRVPLVQLIKGAYGPLKQRFEEKKLSFETEIDESIILNVDPEKFHQILTNLLVNGLKFTEKGHIKVSAEKQDGYAIIKISDTGIGIKKEDQKYIFERFYRSDHSRSRQSGGSGLGLAIVKSYLSAHKADIEVSSESNQGTCFTIKIPLGS